jgi:hypothetical protein
MGKLSMELYLKNLSKRYRTAGKREKGVILQELCESSGYHKKHAVRLLNADSKKRQRKIKTASVACIRRSRNTGRIIPNVLKKELLDG